MGFPVEVLFGKGDIGSALFGVVFGQGLEDEFGAGVSEVENVFSEFDHGEFAGVAEVDGAGDGGIAVHEADEAFDEVVAVAEGAGLLAVAIDGDRFALEGLHDEVGNNASVLGVHAGAVCIEDADDFDLELVLAVVVEEERFGAAFAFVVAGADADGVDVAPVGFGLGVNGGVAIDFGGGGLKYFGFDAFGEAENIDGTVDAGFRGLDGIELVVDGGGGAGQVVNFVDFDEEGDGDVVAHEFEVGVVHEVGDVGFATGKEVIHA